MSVLKAENWDGVTAPAIPAGWNADANLTTSTTVAASAPNALVLSNGAAVSVWNYATWATADTSGGNVVVSAQVYFTATTTGSRWALAARGSAATLSGATTQYIAYIQTGATTPKVRISKLVAGVETVLQTNVPNSNYAIKTWYSLAFTANGSALQLTVQRVSDGFWLNAAGDFAAPTAVAVTATDSSITGAGYAGLQAMQGFSSSGLFTDNWELDSIPSPVWPYPQRLQPVFRPDNRLYWI